MSGARKPKFRVVDTWIAKFSLNVIGQRLLWVIGTEGRQKWVPAERYKDGDRIRITIEKIVPSAAGKRREGARK